jgi:hypothetical protein
MIDTLARHIAALQEARRLVRMVLANNPAFGAISRLETERCEIAGPAAADLFTNDANFRAYCHLTDALAALATSMDPQEFQATQPSDHTGKGRLADRIATLRPCERASVRTPIAQSPSGSAPHLTPPHIDEPWVQVRDEASVAIRRR